MKTYSPNEIKNIAIVGSAGSGKTTLAEAMMYEGGLIPRRGSVSAKNTSSDYRPVEQEYGSSVFPAVLYAEWKDQKLNFIDTPGADDFGSECSKRNRSRNRNYKPSCQADE